ncbi:signal peptidase II [Thermoanaerobacterium thermosaccharolyticum]|uniref:Lipoprotein signal peptidase n=3 Tax=Thermoanaerobacterium thermosaccharolyticum TaxID=1517 RepID=D9TPS8_THETC|nr:signal peptidase II [Thermoanaerobacterium thermosaccharolyticum]ADL68760.1 lipoprotein signal peptidase [Thermoanaerobacterium thermosaccharolyticum DSM 571]AGB18850.1 lipoprotein signal peptidase [Thermoanaerobacterium thermosaccharolyticum M0795]AST59204.1 lipoprotein signal peptidase [Thermoanaerobacterium thermosaccharolyticum]KAA5807573.1 signal peptidase II [Thermoanaerobacterium thermosaccharolyticum]MBE0067919.1 signal peptidase II [Thermoanaerobacterium thermosaccharolyticum]
MEIIIVFIAIIIDQMSKYFVVKYLKPIGSFPIINNIFHFTYVENRGAAFGILQNRTLFFIIITVIVGTILIYSIVKIPGSTFYKFTLSMILGGAIGNLIDRVRLGYVVDFIDFKFFPAVFNLADSMIVVGAFLLCYILIFKKGN